MRTILRLLFALAMGAVIVWSFLVPDAKSFQYPALARILFWHLPCPILLTVFLFAGCWYSLRYFQNIRFQGGMPKLAPETDRIRKKHWDVKAASTMEIGFLFAILTMVTGMLFSWAEWGAWWQWDPRQTSFLLALLIYAAYFAIRGAFVDEEKRNGNSAAYSLAASLPLVFLIYVFPRLPQIAEASLHPTQSIMQGQIKGSYAIVVTLVMTLVGALSIWLVRLRIAAGMLELRSEDIYDRLASGGNDSAPTAVVRPVSLPSES